MKHFIVACGICLGLFASERPALADGRAELRPADIIDAALLEKPAADRMEKRPTAQALKDAWLVGGAADCDACAPEPLDPCDPWQVNLSFGFTSSQGNSEQLDLQLRGEVIYEKGPWYAEARMAFVYGEANGVRSAENYHGEANTRRKLNDRTYAFVKYNYDQDRFADLIYRHRIVAGAGRKFIDRKYTTLNGEVGLGYVFEKRIGLAETEDPSAYLGLDYEHTWMDESKIHVHLDYFPNLNDFDLSLTTIEARYTKPLIGKVNLLLAVRVDWVLDPPPPADPVDLLMIVGLDVSL